MPWIAAIAPALSSSAGAAGSALGSAAGAVGSGLGSAASGIGSAASGLGSAFGSAAEGVGSGLSSLGSDIGSAFSSLFGGGSSGVPSGVSMAGPSSALTPAESSMMLGSHPWSAIGGAMPGQSGMSPGAAFAAQGIGSGSGNMGQLSSMLSQLIGGQGQGGNLNPQQSGSMPGGMADKMSVGSMMNTLMDPNSSIMKFAFKPAPQQQPLQLPEPNVPQVQQNDPLSFLKAFAVT